MKRRLPIVLAGLVLAGVIVRVVWATASSPASADGPSPGKAASPAKGSAAPAASEGSSTESRAGAPAAATTPGAAPVPLTEAEMDAARAEHMRRLQEQKAKIEKAEQLRERERPSFKLPKSPSTDR